MIQAETRTNKALYFRVQKIRKSIDDALIKQLEDQVPKYTIMDEPVFEYEDIPKGTSCCDKLKVKVYAELIDIRTMQDDVDDSSDGE